MFGPAFDAYGRLAESQNATLVAYMTWGYPNGSGQTVRQTQSARHHFRLAFRDFSDSLFALTHMYVSLCLHRSQHTHGRPHRSVPRWFEEWLLPR